MSSAHNKWLWWLIARNKCCIRCNKGMAPHSDKRSNHHPWIERRLFDLLCLACMSNIPWITAVQCPQCGRAQVCQDCYYRKTSSLRCNRSAVKYTDEMKQWLSTYKFQGDVRYGELFAYMLSHVYDQVTLQLVRDQGLYEHWQQSRLPIRSYAKRYHLWHAVTAVPISEERMLERGFNQAQQLALGVAKYSELPFVELLRRDRDSVKLSSKNKRERENSVQQLYTSEASYWLPLMRHGSGAPTGKSPMNILLVDDVYTTGSTIEACSSALVDMAPSGVSIYGLTWARA